jgi:RNA polymerase primary sigma factor
MLPAILTVPGDSLDAYLRTIGRIPLLTPEEERALAARIQEDGDSRAATLLALHNLRWAAKRALSGARAYVGWLGRVRTRDEEPVWSAADAVQAANVGLWTAVWRFEPAAHNNGRFSTYATWWINQSLGRLADPWQYPVPVPAHEHLKLTRLKRAQQGLVHATGRIPTDAELATALAWPVAEVTARRAFLALQLLSLDKPLLTDEPDVTLVHAVADPAGDLWDQLQREILAQDVRRALEVLPRRSAAMVIAYYGIGDDHPRTLEEVGRHYGLTRERIRQIIAELLKMLRTHPKARAALSGWSEALAS